MLAFLRDLASKTIDKCTFPKDVTYFGEARRHDMLLPSGDEKYYSFWVRDASMMAESGLIPDELLRSYVEIIATCGQNGADELVLEHGLVVPPYAIADHINYDGKPVYFPGTYASGEDQGDGSFGFFPPFCDNYYFILMVGQYIAQSGDSAILDAVYGDLTLKARLERAFEGYNIDHQSQLCVSDGERYTVDWGFVDTVKKSGKLLMASLLRYNAARVLEGLFEADGKRGSYKKIAEKIKKSILAEFYDGQSGWLYSATGICRQHDVWATAYAVYSGVVGDAKTLKAISDAYDDKTAAADGYVRHILTNENFSESSAWESSITKLDTYQNGAFWATPTGWYAYAMHEYDGRLDILSDFIAHTKKHADIGAPFEWINADTTDYSGLNYGTSGALPYAAMRRIVRVENEFLIL